MRCEGSLISHPIRSGFRMQCMVQPAFATLSSNRMGQDWGGPTCIAPVETVDAPLIHEHGGLVALEEGVVPAPDVNVVALLQHRGGEWLKIGGL